MKQSKKVLLSAAVVIVMCEFGCKDLGSPPITQPEFFDIEYWFVNQGDAAIRAVEILSITWFRDRKEAWAAKRNFQMPAPFDTLRDVAPFRGSIGCTTQMGIYINKVWGQDSVPCWRFYYFAGYDSVDTYEKRIIIFKWPHDTSNAIHEYVDRIGFCKPNMIGAIRYQK